MRLYTIGTVLSIIIVLFYTRLGRTPLIEVIVINVFMFASISARIISSTALISGIPEPRHRGSFMSVNSSMQQISGGLASALAGLIVAQAPDGRIENFEKLGYCVAVAMVITWIMMQLANRDVQNTTAYEAVRSDGRQTSDL
jgi:predicted MFS family arabinose efflux permease